MKKKIYHGGAFAKRPFTDNPAAVSILDEAKQDSWLRRIVSELNLS